MGKSNFIILSHARSGSHMIASLLDSHPDISCAAEVFNKLDANECNLRYQKYLNSDGNSSKILGFKIPYHLWSSEKNDIWKKAKNNTEFKIIHWRRANLLRAYVSREIAANTMVWLGNDKQPGLIDKKVIIDPKKCFRWIMKIMQQQKISEFEFRNHISYTVTYENFLFDKNQINEILRFLDVDINHELSTPFKRQNPEPLSQLIVNYAEFEKSIIETPWAVFLDNDMSND